MELYPTDPCPWDFDEEDSDLLEEQQVYLPTPEEIQAECRLIRAEWDAERIAESRPCRHWQVPRVRMSSPDSERE